jgi:hypothetical protein
MLFNGLHGEEVYKLDYIEDFRFLLIIFTKTNKTLENF